MIDIDSATESAKTLMRAGANSITNLPMVSKKGDWKTQITGVYDLIFPDLNKDFPTRMELLQTLTNMLSLHNTSNLHNGYLSSPGTPTPCTVSSIPKEQIIGKIKVRAGSTVNAIGYGV